MKLHEQIKKRREKLGMTPYALGKLIDVNPSHIEKWESGEHNPSLNMLFKLCAALNISITILPNGDTKINNNG